MSTKICARCNQELPLELFTAKRNPFASDSFNYSSLGRKKTEYSCYCKPCNNHLAREWRKNNKGYSGTGKFTKYTAEERKILSCISSKVASSKANTVKKGNKVPCTITRDEVYAIYLQQGGKCVLSGLDLSIDKHSLRGLSIDKIDPEKGYVSSNIQLLCWAVNRAKGEMTTDDFIKMCRIITEKCND